MCYELSLSPGNKYVICRVKGPTTAELAREFGQKTDVFAREHNVQARLVDVRDSRNVEPIPRNYDFAYKEMPHLGIDQNSRIAILVTPDDQSHDFPIIVMKNAGYNIEKFTDERLAIDWLVAEQF